MSSDVYWSTCRVHLLWIRHAPCPGGAREVVILDKVYGTATVHYCIFLYLAWGGILGGCVDHERYGIPV